MPSEKFIPASTRVLESRVINASSDRVFELIKPLDFSFLSTVKNTKVEGPVNAVGSTRVVSFNDGSVQTFKILEISELSPKSISYEIIESNPSLPVSAAIHTIKVREITFDNSSLVEWQSDFSNDATQAVVQDSKYKKLEAFEDLSAAVSKKNKNSEGPKSPSKKAKK